MLYWNCGQWHSQSQWQSVWVADIWVTQIGHLGDMPWTLGWDTIGNKSVLKIVINDTMNLFYRTAISILLISNHNSQWVLFDKIASEYFIWKIYLYFSIGNGQPREPALCQLYLHTFVPHWLIVFNLNLSTGFSTCCLCHLNYKLLSAELILVLP